MDEGSALWFPSFYVRQDAFVLLFGDLGALESVFGKRISNYRDLFGFLRERFNKLK